MAKNPYVNDRRVQNHVPSNRPRAWSESTCTSLLSYSESDASFQSGSGSALSPLAGRPLPDIPAESAAEQIVNQERRQVVTPRCVSDQRRNSSTTKRKRKKSARSSHRKTLIFLSIAAIVFSLFCLSLLAVTFFRHGIRPWDDVLPQTDVAKSCQHFVGQLQSFVQCAASRKISDRAFNLLPSDMYCRPMAFQHSNGSSYTMKEQSGNNRLTLAQNGLYYVTLRVEIRMEDEWCEVESLFHTIHFEMNHQSIAGCKSSSPLSLQLCEQGRKDNPRIFCLGEIMNLTKGDVLSANYGPAAQVEPAVHLRVIQLFEI